MYFVKTPRWVQHLLPNYCWRITTDAPIIYLTFDDGPIPEVTPWVVEQLAIYNAKATFFCVGENVQKHPTVFQQVIDAGHTIGNHTHHHLNGWTTQNNIYFDDVQLCAQQVDSDLFRPPYGRLKPKQAQFLQGNYHIVMWDILSGDFDPNISAEQCLKNVLQHTRNGSILVFHDSLKAQSKLEYVLPKVLNDLHQKGFQFHALTSTTMLQ